MEARIDSTQSEYMSKRKRRHYDIYRLRLSLAGRPGNWQFNGYSFENESERMAVWTANGFYGLEFAIEDRMYGKDSPKMLFSLFGWLSPWRRAVCTACFEALKTGRIPGTEGYYDEWVNDAKNTWYYKMLQKAEQQNEG